MTHTDKARWKVISPLLDRLLDLDPLERTSRLDEIRKDDPRLAAELDALLAQQTIADREAFLEGGGVELSIRIGTATFAGVSDHAHARGILGRAGDVHAGPVALVERAGVRRCVRCCRRLL